MFSNILINLLSETQLGGCIALSCVLGRRGEGGGGEGGGVVELTFVPTRRGINTLWCYTHGCSHIWTHTGLMWLQRVLADSLVCMFTFGECAAVLHTLTND